MDEYGLKSFDTTSPAELLTFATCMDTLLPYVPYERCRYCADDS
jgi:hypothetical protein